MDVEPKTEDLVGADGQTRPQARSASEFFSWAFLRIKETQKYWLLPVLVLLMLVGLFLNLFTGYNVLPAIYSLIP